MSLDRREFLRRCGYGAAGAATLGLSPSALAQEVTSNGASAEPLTAATLDRLGISRPCPGFPEAGPRPTGNLIHTPSPALSQVISSGSGPRTRAARIGHITDTHVTDSWNGTSNVIAEMQAVFGLLNGMPDMPNLILHGGDIINDALAVSKTLALQQVGYWQQAAMGNSIPIRYCCGNHDILGWGGGGTPTSDPLYGKAFFADQFGESPYYSFDHAGWHIIVLDSDSPKLPTSGFQYHGRIDSAQFAWLQADLAATPPVTPILVLSHFPIVSGCVYRIGWITPFQPGVNVGDAAIWIKDNAAHTDTTQLMQLFGQYPNIKLCLSGHVHLFDHIEAFGVHYICSGSVAGYWWQRPNIYLGVPAGFGIVDLYTDGTFDYHFVTANTPGYWWAGSTINVPSLPANLTVFEAL